MIESRVHCGCVVDSYIFPSFNPCYPSVDKPEPLSSEYNVTLSSILCYIGLVSLPPPHTTLPNSPPLN
jgi:hypothetical protein